MQQQAVVAQQFGNTASAYLTSTVHAQGADLQQLHAIAAALPKRPVVLDLGCGAGHASFAVAPAAASVTAFDLSPEMLAVVANAARDRSLDNIGTQQGNVASLPFADAAFCMVITRFSAHHWLDAPAACAKCGACWKLTMQFDHWTARMRTPAERITAIRSLLRSAPQETRSYFTVQPDDSFTIDSTLFRAQHAFGDSLTS